MVVFPASMCAMIPMLRVFSSDVTALSSVDIGLRFLTPWVSMIPLASTRELPLHLRAEKGHKLNSGAPRCKRILQPLSGPSRPRCLRLPPHRGVQSTDRPLGGTEWEGTAREGDRRFMFYILEKSVDTPDGSGYKVLRRRAVQCTKRQSGQPWAPEEASAGGRKPAVARTGL